MLVAIMRDVINLGVEYVEVLPIQDIHLHRAIVIHFPFHEDNAHRHKCCSIVQTLEHNITNSSTVVVPGNEFAKRRNCLINVVEGRIA
jgi:hypothetical protein